MQTVAGQLDPGRNNAEKFLASEATVLSLNEWLTLSDTFASFRSNMKRGRCADRPVKCRRDQVACPAPVAAWPKRILNSLTGYWPVVKTAVMAADSFGAMPACSVACLQGMIEGNPVIGIVRVTDADAVVRPE